MRTYAEMYTRHVYEGIGFLCNPDVNPRMQLKILPWRSCSEHYLRLQVNNQEKLRTKQENYSFDTLQVIVEEKGCELGECGETKEMGSRRTEDFQENLRTRGNAWEAL